MTHELSPEARGFLERGRDAERMPSEHELQRIRNNVVLGVAPAGLLLATGKAAAAATKLSALSLLGLAAKGGLLGTLVAFGGYALQRVGSDPSPSPAVVQSVATATTFERPGAQNRSGTPPVAPALVASVTTPPPTPSSAPTAFGALERAAADDSASLPSDLLPSVGSLPVSAELLEEVQDLKRVQEHLRAGRGTEALRVLDASSSRLGQGQLRQERLAAEVFAACQSGRMERARQAARRFMLENPATPSAARLKTSCVGEEIDRP
jgi:hypothetical protein